MLIAIQGVKGYVHCCTWSEAFAHFYTWSNALGSLLYKE